MGSCTGKSKKPQHKTDLKPINQWPDSPLRKHVGEGSFRYGTDLYVNLKNGPITQFYNIEKEIGAGKFGVVKLVTHIKTGQKRAMKAIAKKKIVQDEKAQMFSEVNILRKFDHPNIIKLFEIYEDAKNYYLVTEYLEGGEVLQKIRSTKQMSEKQAASIMKQLLSSVAYCHKQKIVHRDLKLEHILYATTSEDSAVKVIGFGTSRKIFENQFLQSRLGTPIYCAPEVFRQKYTEKCDIWSCGVILYILLCGYPPFNGSDAYQTQYLIELGKYKFYPEEWGQISSGAKDLIIKMLKYDQNQRISAEEALQDKWIQHNSNQSLLNTKVLSNLEKFYEKNKVKGLVMQFMAFYTITVKEKEELTKQFQSLDQDQDGLLSKEELIRGYLNVYQNNQPKCEKIVNHIIASCNRCKSGLINFHEFITAVSEKEKLLCEQKLDETFQLFDIDNDGQIKKKNLEQALGGIEIEEKQWQEILDACDVDKDGMINKQEFFNLMMHDFK